MSNHDKFLSHLNDSKDAVWVTARWLSGLGYDVQVAATREAPTHEQWKQYADNGDIYIAQRVEVKQLSAEFTGPDDWPFGEKFIVCAKHSFDRAKPRPLGYVILSKSARYAAIVKSETAQRWRVETRSDHRYEGVEQEFYMAPMDAVTFLCLDARRGGNGK